MEKDEKQERPSREPGTSREEYTRAYIKILDTYDSQIRCSIYKRNELKDQFFIMVNTIMKNLICLFKISIIASFAACVFLAVCKCDAPAVIAGIITSVVSSFVTMILSILKLPQIIAEYLFNKEEDRMMNEVIKNIQTYEIDVVKAERHASSEKAATTVDNKTEDDTSVQPTSKSPNTEPEDNETQNSTPDDTQDNEPCNPTAPT